MPTEISRLGARGRREWVATIFATVEIGRGQCGRWPTGLHFRYNRPVVSDHQQVRSPIDSATHSGPWV